VKPSNQDLSNPHDGAPRGSDGIMHANGQPGEDDRWLHSVVRNSSEIVSIVAPDGIVRYANPAWERVLGYDPRKVVGMNVLDYVHPEDLPHILEETEKALSEEGVARNKAEYRFRHKDGSWRWLESMGVYLLDDPAVGGVMVTSRDVTERKEGEEALHALRREHEELVGSIEAIIWKGEAQTLRFTFVSDHAEAILGYPARRWTEEPSFWSDHIHPEDRDWAVSFCRKAVVEKKDHDFEYRMISANGDVVWLRDIVRVGVEDGVPTQLFGVMVDVTGRKEAEEALRTSESSLVAAQRIAHIGDFEYSVEEDEAHWSDELYRIFGFAPRQFVPTYKTFLRSVHPDDKNLVREAVREAQFGEKQGGGDYRIVRPDGGVRVVRSHYEVIHDVSNRIIKLVGTVHDITERRALEEQLQHQAFHDSLTDLPNRRLFVNRLEHALERTKRGTGRQVAVLLMDLDGFKNINDSLGHEAGDLLLVVMTERLKRCMRPEDTLARFGGDEFTALVEDVDGPEDAVRLAERLVECLGEPFVVEGTEMFVGASIGIALGSASTKSSEEMLRDADTAMYRAKEAGSGYRLFDPEMYERAVERLELENNIRRAVRTEEFVVHYQPIVHLRSGEVRKVEALVRWKHPERGLLDPSQFLPVAEESGLVVPLGEGVLEEACRQGQRWQDEHPRVPPLIVCVNLSARQLRDPRLVKTVEDVLQRTGFEAHRLSLEITETVYIKILEGNTAALDKLTRQGVCISIDDFGVGYSSLAYLKRLPADAVKIDKSFVAGIGEDVEDTAIVGMVIDLAHTLGMEAVAEGVESEEQATLLREMGCDHAQGFHFSKALPPEAASRFLASR